MTLRKIFCAAALTAIFGLTSPLVGPMTKDAAAQMLRPVAENHKTYLVNGLASVMPFIGYGFANLKEKLGDAKHYAYATPVEGRMVIQPAVLEEIRQEYARDRSVKINLVGISYGGNIVTSLAAQLHELGIPVNYMGVLDGPVLMPITPNVHRVDNFVCRMPGCMGQKIRLTKGNNWTLRTKFVFATSHVGLGKYKKVHDRIIAQLTAYPLYVAGPPIGAMATASVVR